MEQHILDFKKEFVDLYMQLLKAQSGDESLVMHIPIGEKIQVYIDDVAFLYTIAEKEIPYEEVYISFSVDDIEITVYASGKEHVKMLMPREVSIEGFKKMILEEMKREIKRLKDGNN